MCVGSVRGREGVYVERERGIHKCTSKKKSERKRKREREREREIDRDIYI